MVPFLALAVMGLLTVLAPVMERRLGRSTGYALAAGFVGVAVLLGSVSSAVLNGGTVTESWSWIPSPGVRFTLRLDGLASLFCLLVLGVGALIMAYCPRYLPAEGRHGRIYFLLTLFGSAMLGLVLAGDLVLLFVFWELTTVVSFFLIGAAGAKGVRPAVRALYVTGLGGLALLAAVVLLAAGLLIPAPGRRPLHRLTAAAVHLGVLLLSGFLLARTLDGAVVTQHIGGWPPGFAIVFAADVSRR